MTDEQWAKLLEDEKTLFQRWFESTGQDLEERHAPVDVGDLKPPPPIPPELRAELILLTIQHQQEAYGNDNQL